MASTTSTEASKGDIWIAVAVVVCIGLGATMTYVLTGSRAAPQPSASIPIKGDPLKGVPMNTVPTTTTSMPAETAVAPKPPEKPGAPDAYLPVTFDTLASYYYEVPNLEDVAENPASAKRPKDQIPAPIKEMNGKKVSIQGFMVPLKVDKGETKQFLLVKDRTVCCFGRIPRMNEWVSVKLTQDRSTKFIADQPITIFGVLSVGEEIQNGDVLSIYRFEADDVAGPLDL